VAGYGASAVVHAAIFKLDGRKVAIKIIDLDAFERTQIDQLRREIQNLSLCRHPNVLRVYGSFVENTKLYIVTPFLAGGSCLDIMKFAHPEGLEETVVATILKHTLLGLAYLHRQGFIHRDVKAGNLLLDSDGTVLLADFGVSSSLMETGERRCQRKTFVGTPCWMAPEVMEQSPYDTKADIWSFGITCLELANGNAPYSKFPPLKVLMLTLNNDPPTLDRDKTKHKYSKSFKELIDLCLQKDPAKRPSAEKLLQQSFFAKAKKPQYLCTNLLKDIAPLEARQRKSRWSI
ncbi:kinase-like domain-containing protein, partial [Thamnocephalis sphaerospora]